MSNETTETTTEVPVSPPSVRWWSRLRIWLWEGTPRISVIIGGVLGYGMLFMLFVQQSNIAERNRQSDLRAGEQTDYVQAVTNYASIVAAYQVCIQNVALDLKVRAQWTDLIAVIRDLGPDAEPLADRVAAGPLLSSAPADTSDCIDPGLAPQPPPR